MINELLAMISNGLLFALIGVLMLLETLVLLIYWLLFKRGIAPLKLIGNVASGSCLIAAIWVAQTSQSEITMLSLLLLSLLFHVIDLFSRWQTKTYQ